MAIVPNGWLSAYLDTLKLICLQLKLFRRNWIGKIIQYVSVIENFVVPCVRSNSVILSHVATTCWLKGMFFIVSPFVIRVFLRALLLYYSQNRLQLFRH